MTDATPTTEVSAPASYTLWQLVRYMLALGTWGNASGIDRARVVAYADYVGGGYGVPTFGPTNYAACLGSGATNGGAPYGSPWDADGAFRAQVKGR